MHNFKKWWNDEWSKEAGNNHFYVNPIWWDLAWLLNYKIWAKFDYWFRNWEENRRNSSRWRVITAFLILMFLILRRDPTLYKKQLLPDLIILTIRKNWLNNFYRKKFTLTFELITSIQLHYTRMSNTKNDSCTNILSVVHN